MKKAAILVLAAAWVLLCAACGDFFSPHPVEEKAAGPSKSVVLPTPSSPFPVGLKPGLFVSAGDSWEAVLASLDKNGGAEPLIDLSELREDLAAMLEVSGFDGTSHKFSRSPRGQCVLRGVPYHAVNSFVYESGGVKLVDRYWGDDWPAYQPLDPGSNTAVWSLPLHRYEREDFYREFTGAGLIPVTDMNDAVFSLYGSSTRGIRYILEYLRETYPSGWAEGGCEAALPEILFSLERMEDLAQQFYLGAIPGVMETITLPNGSALVDPTL